MSQSLAQVYVHLIFSTKRRAPLLVPEIREDLRAYFGGVLRKMKCPALAVGCVSDHVHILFAQYKTAALDKVVQEAKVATSIWLKTRDSRLHRFGWQNGYGAFSVSASRRDAVIRYIQSQEQRHAKTTFQEEFRRFLAEYRVEYDERYVWD